MSIEYAATSRSAAMDSIVCGGFWAVWLDGRPAVRLASGERRLSPVVIDAVLAALADAPDLLARAVGVRARKLPWERVEVSLAPGSRVGGEAAAFGSGCIKLSIGEEAAAEDAARIARHEALHLLLAATLRGGEAWCQPDLAFAEWIVRGIEAWPGDGVPEISAPLLLDPLPTSRAEVERRIASIDHDLESALRWLGEPLYEAMRRIPPSETAEQRRLWLVEAALGTHYLRAASRLWTEDADALRPIVLDDWLLDYQEYARGVANPPEGSGHLWRLSEAGWSRDPLVRLSVAAQAVQAEDHCWFADSAPASDPVVWKNRGRVRLPLLAAPSSARRPPLHAFRSALREVPGEQGRRALALLEDAARGCERFEARALWPRLLARLIAADAPWPQSGAGPAPCVYVMDSPEACLPWSEAAAALRAILGDRARVVPEIRAPAAAATLGGGSVPPASVLLVYGGAPTPASLLEARRLAARIPVRGALFFETLGGGAAGEQVADVDDPVDPRYREATWERGPVPASLAELVPLVDAATAQGQLRSALAHLLSIASVGLEECHSPHVPTAAPR